MAYVTYILFVGMLMGLSKISKTKYYVYYKWASDPKTYPLLNNVDSHPKYSESLPPRPFFSFFSRYFSLN